MNGRNDKSGSDVPYRRHIMKIDLTAFHKRDFKYDHTLYGKITIDDGGSQRDIEAEIRPDINGTIYESSKEELQFFVDNYEKYREIYLDALLSYYQEYRTGLGYYGEEEVDGYPYITTIEQLIETITFTGIVIHEEKRGDHHANTVREFLWQVMMSLIPAVLMMPIMLMH